MSKSEIDQYDKLYAQSQQSTTQLAQQTAADQVNKTSARKVRPSTKRSGSCVISGMW